MTEIIKKIHYCWFGGNEFPDSAKKCIDSWKQFFPDYEIIQWNEENFDVNICRYTREAYSKKKWAFVSDYARFRILYEHGGLYFDTDVEVIRKMDDILKRGSFMGCEGRSINTGLGLYAAPGLGLYAAILDYYERESFLLKDGTSNLKTVVTRVTQILEQYGFDKRKDNEIQNVEGVYIYPPDYFAPMDYATRKLVITENTRSIHHYDNSWYDERNIYWQKLRLRLNRFMPNALSARTALIISLVKFGGARGLVDYFRYREK